MNPLRASILRVWIGLLTCVSCGYAQSPATAEQAAAVLNLATFPLVDGALEPNYQTIAGQSYSAPSTPPKVAEVLRDALKKQGFEELDGSAITEAYASCNFRKDGFLVTLMVTPSGMPDRVQVQLTNHGNVDLSKIPVPDGTSTLYTFPAMVAFITARPVEETQKAMRELLAKAGWAPFGETTVSFFVKQNAVRLQVMVMAAPAQEGKTMIQVTGEQLSIDLPAPADAENLQYTDGTGQLFFDSPQPQSELVGFLKQELGKRGWTATTENPVRIGFRDHLIFRNPGMDMIEVDFSEFEGKTRTNLKYQTAAQVDATESRVKEEMAAREAARREAAKPVMMTVELPKGTKLTEEKPASLTFTTASGKARDVLKEWLKTYEKDGWKIERTIDEAAAGNYTLTRESQRFDITYVDPGVFVPGEVTVRATGTLQFSLKK